MTLLSMLLALIAQQRGNWSKFWTHQKGFQHYFSYMDENVKRFIKEPALYATITILMPILGLWILLTFTGTAITFIVSTVVLFACLQDADNKNHYKQLMKSLSKSDNEGAEYHSEQLGEPDISSVGLQLIYLNYRNFFAVLFLFALFGSIGVLLYTTIKLFIETSEQDESITSILNQVLHIVELVPVRAAGLAYLVVGNFSRGLSAWLENVFVYDLETKTFLSVVASKSIDTVFRDNSGEITVDIIAAHTHLCRRSVVLIVVTVAILTLSGGLA